MKTFTTFIILFALFHLFNLSQFVTAKLSKVDEDKIGTISKSLGTIIESYYSKNYQTFDYIIIDKENEVKSNEIINRISKKCGANSQPVTTYLIDDVKSIRYLTLKRSSIIFISSESHFIHLQRKAFSQSDEYVRLHHFAFVFDFDITTTNLLKLKLAVNNILHYCSVMYQDPNSFNIKLLATNSLASICKNETTLFFQNEYNAKKNQWKSLNFAVKEVTNFKNCSFMVYCSTGNSLLGFVDGYLNTMNHLGVKFQFQATASMMEHNTDVHMAIQFSYSMEKYNTFIFINVDTKFIYSAGEAYNAYEKLLLPFDSTTWILIVSFFLVGIITILVIRMCNIGRQKFVYGSAVKSPIFNMFIAFFGQSQSILPGRNFARFLLMSFVLFCIVIRTGYQGVQYELLLKDVRKKSPNTIQELEDEGYKMPCFPSLDVIRHYTMKELLTNSKVNQSCTKNESAQGLALSDPNYFNFKNKYLYIVLRPKSDIAKLASAEFIMNRNKTEKYNDPVRFTSDSLLSTTMGFAVTKNAFMFKTFRNYIQRMFESGLLLKSDGENWYDKAYEHIYHKHKEIEIFDKDSQHVVLGWKHLHAGFYVWMFAVVACTLVFLAEIVTDKLMDSCQN